jgi:transposase InsO family protein
VLKTPVRAPQANAFCECLIGTIRKECLDFVIPLNEGHVRRLLREWVAHYNRGRPHASLGPGIADPPHDGLRACSSGYQIRDGHRVIAKPVLGGLHHEYRLEPIAAWPGWHST